MPAGGERGVYGPVSSHHVIAEDVRAVHSQHQLGPAVRAGGLEGDVQGEVPHQSARGVQTLLGDLRDALLPPRPAMWIINIIKIVNWSIGTNMYVLGRQHTVDSRDDF